MYIKEKYFTFLNKLKKILKTCREKGNKTYEKYKFNCNQNAIEARKQAKYYFKLFLVLQTFKHVQSYKVS